MEKIKLSAVKFENGKVYCGKRHNDCFKVAHDAGEESPRHEVQGFITNEDRFVNRREAYDIAVRAGQIKEGRKSISDVIYLYSEDLW